MKFATLLLVLSLAPFARSLGDEDADGKIWLQTPKECIVSRDTLGISAEKQNIVVIRYSYEDFDSLECYVITSLPDIKSLNGSDFFYNFVASFFVRTLIWSRLVIGTIEETRTDKHIDKVWADVEGILREAEPTIDPQPIILHHQNYGNEYENYYENPVMDSYLLGGAQVEKKDGDGWLHFTLRVKKNQ